MKCCCRRPTVAYIIGLFHSIINIVAAIYFVMPLYYLNHHEDEISIATIVLQMACYIGVTSCFVGICLGALMARGVYVKRYKLMTPYVHFGLVGLLGSGLVYVFIIGGLIWHLVPLSILFNFLTDAIWTEGLQLLVWLPIFNLHEEWKAEANRTQRLHQMDDPISNRSYHDVYGAVQTPVVAPEVV